MIAVSLLLLASASGSVATSSVVPVSLSMPARLVTAPQQLAVGTTPILSTPVRATPLGDPAEWVSGSDRPAGEAGIGQVRLRLSLARDGTPLSCAVLRGVSDAIDSASCRAMLARARFQPVAAADRRPIRLFSEQTILWRATEVRVGAQADPLSL
jgi:hypothetical protein